MVSVTDELNKMQVRDAPIQEMIHDLVAHRVALTSTLPVFELFVRGTPRIEQRGLEAMSKSARY